jgi:hypothetical protein
MSAMTRRKFLKRTGAASVAAVVVAMNFESAKGQIAVPGTGSSYRLESDWRGGGYADPTYDELEYSNSNVHSRAGVRYDAKIKMWTEPGTGKHKSEITNKFSLEIIQYGNGGNPAGAAPDTSSQREYVVKLPNPFSPTIQVEPFVTGIVDVGTLEWGKTLEFYGNPLPGQEPIPSWLSAAFPLPASAIPPGSATPYKPWKVLYTSKIYAWVAPFETQFDTVFVVSLTPRLAAQEWVVYQSDPYVNIHSAGPTTYDDDSGSHQLQVASYPDP